MATAAKRELEIAMLEHKLRHVSPEAKAAAARVTQRIFATEDKRTETEEIDYLAVLSERMEEARVALSGARNKQLAIEEEHHTSTRLDGEGLRPVIEFHNRHDVEAYDSNGAARLAEENAQSLLESYRKSAHASMRRRQQFAKQISMLRRRSSSNGDAFCDPESQAELTQELSAEPNEEFDAAEFDQILSGGRVMPTPTPYQPLPERSSMYSSTYSSRSLTSMPSSLTESFKRSSAPEAWSERTSAPHVLTSSSSLKRTPSQPIPFRRWSSMPKATSPSEPAEATEPAASASHPAAHTPVAALRKSPSLQLHRSLPLPSDLHAHRHSSSQLHTQHTHGEGFPMRMRSHASASDSGPAPSEPLPKLERPSTTTALPRLPRRRSHADAATFLSPRPAPPAGPPPSEPSSGSVSMRGRAQRTVTGSWRV